MDGIDKIKAVPESAVKVRSDRPLRILGLEDWGVINGLSLAEFDELRHRLIYDPQAKCETLLGQTIVRACTLLFLLVEAGGLCTPNPPRDIEQLRRTRLVGL